MGRTRKGGSPRGALPPAYGGRFALKGDAAMAKETHPKIDPVFSKIHRPLTSQEYDWLERTQIAAGRILEDVEVWHDLLVDGHSRLEIAKTHKLPYQVKILDPNWTREQVIQYIDDKQGGRRNLIKQEYEALIARTYLAIKKDKSETLKKGDDSPIVQNELSGGSLEKVAEQFKTSTSSVKRAVDRTALRGSLAEGLRRTLEGAKKKVTDDQLRAMAAMSESEQLMAAEQIRKFSQPIDQAIKLASGKSVKTLAGTSPKKPRASKDSEPQEPKPRDDKKFVQKQWTGMMKTLDSLCQRIDQLVGDGLVTRNFVKPLLSEIDVPRKRLWKWTHDQKST